MNFTEILDFNTASTNQASYSPIPANTCVKACFTIRNGHCVEDPCLTRSPNTGSLYLAGEFTVLEGPFTRRKVFQNIGIVGIAKEGDQDAFGVRGRSLIRGVIESAKNISPNDNSLAACEARKINGFNDLNGLVCVIKVGIENDKSGRYNNRNSVICAVTPDKREFQQTIGEAGLDNQNSWC
jgi:hypothetical protein